MNIKDNIEEIEKRIVKASKKSGRTRDEIMFLAVTKTHSAKIVDIALDNKIEFIAENKIQEAENKLPALTNPYKEFHFIGHLQSNKVKKLMKLKPSLIHSIDKFSTAETLNSFCIKNNIVQKILVQVNTSNEKSKFGITPEETVDFVKKVSLLKNLKIVGLMTIGMFTDNQLIIRDCFHKLKTLFDEINLKKIANVEMKYLSMGMTNDFEIAIEEGANIVRIGSAIFGDRDYR